MSFDEMYGLWQDQAPKADRAEDYLSAKMTNRSTPILAPPELRTRYHTPLRWAALVTGALEERISITDITCESARVAKWLRTTWRDIDGDLLSSRTHTESLGKGRSYVAVSRNEDGSPRASMLTAKSTVHRMDPDTGQIKEALRVYGRLGDQATYYEVGRTTTYKKAPVGDWRAVDVYDHGFPRVSIVVFAARSARQDGYGDPVARSIWGLQDAATRVATDGSIAGALMSVPQRVIKGASVEETKQSAEKLYLARLLTLSKSDASIEQFAAAQLQQFGTLLATFARQAASVSGIPVSMFGVASEANPASGDSQRQDDSRITRRAERLSRDFTSSWELVLQLLLDFYPADISQEVRRTVTVEWLKADNPSRAELADMALKLASAKYGADGQPLVSRQFILSKLGLTDTEIEAELDRIEEDALTQLLREPEEGDPSGEGNPSPPEPNVP